jgi:2,6-dihydroxypseudooxynicotine hydrolase
MAENTLGSVLHAHGGRLAGDGVPATDIEQVAASISEWSQWFGAWAKLGERYRQEAEDALAAGARVTAGEMYWHASLSYQYAQFLWFHEPERREEGQRRKQELYRTGAPYLLPPAERFDLPIDHAAVPGYVRFPPGEGETPCVVLLGGLESTKEESYLFEQMCLRRGLAVCTFDGPGQGEMFFQLGLMEDFERYTSRVIDHLAGLPRIDANRIGILGRSLGGYYAVRSAALEPRIKACVAWGALYDMSWWEGIPPLTQSGFLHVTRRNRDDALRFLKEAITLDGIAERLRCPLYVLHGAQDTVIPGNQVERLEADTRAIEDRTFNIPEEGNHCCHNMYAIVRPRMADWLAAKLEASSQV